MMETTKVRSLTELAEIAVSAKQSGKRIAFAFGLFDLLHMGHIKQLESSKRNADLLIVGIMPDEPVHRVLGRPVFGQAVRLGQLASLPAVDYVCVAEGLDPSELVQRLKPDVVVVSHDTDEPSLRWRDRERWATMGIEVVDGRVSPALVPDRFNLQRDLLPEHVRSYFDGLKQSYTLRTIQDALARLRDLRVLVVGDLIIDQYCYCRVSGTVSKWPVLAAVYQDMRQMAGGSAAIARHVKQFAGEVQCLSAIGDQDETHRFAERLLEAEGISHRFFPWPETFTVTKRRYITGGYPNPLALKLQIHDGQPSTRLFEIGFMPQVSMPTDLEEHICRYLQEVAPVYDVVILSDFGHGFVSARVAQAVADHARWWAVNAQTNSSNYGFNRVTKYRNPQFVCIDELEARLPVGNTTQPLEEIVAQLETQMRFGSLMVTRGREGLVLFNRQAIHRAPALATRTVDTVGAGDAVLALASLCRAKGIEDEMTVFLSACAGALASWIVGNEEPVVKSRLLAWVEDVLR